ncbi:MAG TPA: dTDP-4-dehydrorhamnose 3,5-epimerase [Bacteroidales bacterium]|nr:dTDP-4-dehydrorhamnose 3,5-epimerase [Bacteroidales bacterium]
MNVVKTDIPGLLIIEPKVYEDARGYFFESYNEEAFFKAGIQEKWVQDNQSRSVYGVIRGLHYQLEPFAQSKLVRVIEGEIYDVAVDIRKGSPTYKKWYGIKLSASNFRQLYIPKGFAHGFSVLSPTAIVLYKCDALYNPSSERGIVSDDPDLGINWLIPSDHIVLSPKDRNLPLFKDAENNFVFSGI